jgi:hypothetical protein
MDITEKNQSMIDLNYMVETFDKTWMNAFAFKALGGVIVTITSFFMPIQPFIWLTLGLVFADFATGIMASRYPKDKDKKVTIQSSKVMRSVYKMGMYGIAIIIWHSIGLVFFPTFELAYFATFFIMFTEINSIDENYKIIIGDSLLTKMKSKIKIK